MPLGILFYFSLLHYLFSSLIGIFHFPRLYIHVVYERALISLVGENNEWSVESMLTRKVRNRTGTSDSAHSAGNQTRVKRSVPQTVRPECSTAFICNTTLEALNSGSVFVNHTIDRNVSIPLYNDPTWKDIQYFPWEESFDYDRICKTVLKQITRKSTFYIISGGLSGGLGHKYLSVFYSITYAILLGRRFLGMIDQSVLLFSSTP